MEKKYPIGETVTILINVDTKAIDSVYADKSEGIEACRINRDLAPVTFPVKGSFVREGAVWVIFDERHPDTYKVRFKDKHGNIFKGNYSSDTRDFYAYGFLKKINDVTEWAYQDEIKPE